MGSLETQKGQKMVRKQTELLDELIDNATGLPVESQELLLMMARGMAYTRECMSKTKVENEKEENSSE